jgi:hypothetical protein
MNCYLILICYARTRTAQHHVLHGFSCVWLASLHIRTLSPPLPPSFIPGHGHHMTIHSLHCSMRLMCELSPSQGCLQNPTSALQESAPYGISDYQQILRSQCNTLHSYRFCGRPAPSYSWDAVSKGIECALPPGVQVHDNKRVFQTIKICYLQWKRVGRVRRDAILVNS